MSGFEFNEQGLVIIGNPTIEDWREEYQNLKQGAKGMYKKLGDLLAYGQIKYGDLIDQEADESDCDDPVFNHGTLYNAKYVSSRWWPPSRRIYKLPWSYYQETAPLTQHQQDIVMAMAEELGWNRDKVRQSVANYQQNNGKREYIPKRPDDIIFEQQQEIEQLRDELNEAKSHAALNSPGYLPEMVTRHISYVQSYLQGRPWRGVTIWEDGNTEWIER